MLKFEKVDKTICKRTRTSIAFANSFEQLKIRAKRQHNNIDIKGNNVVNKFTVSLVPGPRVEGALKGKRGHWIHLPSDPSIHRSHRLSMNRWFVVSVVQWVVG